MMLFLYGCCIRLEDKENEKSNNYCANDAPKSHSAAIIHEITPCKVLSALRVIE